MTDLDAASLRVEEILGDAFAAAYGLDLETGEPPDFDPDLEDDE